MPEFDLALVIASAKAATLTFGTILTWLSARAYRRTGAPALRALTVGIGLVTAGAILGGIVHQVAGLRLLAGIAVQSVFTAFGFAVLTYSLYADGSSDAPSRGSSNPAGNS
ncbi:MAG: hypothetical protein ABEJ40_08975 [Haloarculaceae archaeon]